MPSVAAAPAPATAAAAATERGPVGLCGVWLLAFAGVLGFLDTECAARVGMTDRAVVAVRPVAREASEAASLRGLRSAMAMHAEHAVQGVYMCTSSEAWTRAEQELRARAAVAQREGVHIATLYQMLRSPL